MTSRPSRCPPRTQSSALHSNLLPEASRSPPGLGCFWGAERIFWQTDGVYSTAVGYAGGSTPNPTYEEACSGRTGHTEAVQVVYDPAKVSYRDLLKIFWESYNPTQGYRQGNDVGTQYRSAIYTFDDEQAKAAAETRDAYAVNLKKAGYGDITTEIAPLARSGTPRTTTSSTCTRSRGATAPTMAPASRVLSLPAPTTNRSARVLFLDVDLPATVLALAAA